MLSYHLFEDRIEKPIIVCRQAIFPQLYEVCAIYTTISCILRISHDVVQQQQVPLNVL